ncbi:transcriptional activator xlnR [Pseudomassariella vexata]|uniref:Transcriptional activator xlnR n=1 Tax=Pseudomassariella vexata TaxID=1141098 RepID=A0A1Y2E0M6_9PEZI|nr:transcriptional activator xlnR [Pseudomassariella vexata]ORY65029.1 transcriptional activator xlnR [Pseudomassariella vexata]
MMLSNPLQRFSPYHSIPSTTLLSNSHVPASHLHGGGLDSFGHASQYGLQHLQQHVGMHAPHLARAPPPKHRHHPYGGPTTRATGSAGPIRRRISRACDQCNQLRTKCDGQHPCAHCIEFGLGCEYIRERKKRGKASRKDLAQQAAAQAAAAAQSGQQSPSHSGDNSSTGDHRTETSSSVRQEQQSNASEKALNDLSEDAMQRSQRTSSLDSLAELSSHQSHLPMDRDHLDSPTSLDLNAYASLQNPYDRQGISAHMMTGAAHNPYGAGQTNMSNYPEIPYPLQTRSAATYPANAAAFRIGTSPLDAYAMAGEPTSPDWMSMSSHIPQNNYHQQLRYPVLDPLMPHLGNIIPAYLACDLIDLYFASSSSAHAHPMSPYVLGFVFRKRSFLHPSKPRQCQPALLASILWVAAQTSDAPFLASIPSARGKICQKLLELTVTLLKPLIHTQSGEASPISSPVIDGVALGGLGVALPGSTSLENLTGESGAFGAAGTLDDVITYIHLATVVSASEYKGASLRWWNAAWSLARELKLGRELPKSTSAPGQRNEEGNGIDGDGETEDSDSGVATEEEREERRRIWWLTYIVDRHLALCYNRPLFLLDIECEGLLQPMDDTEWQNGNFRPGTTDPALSGVRVRGPHFECSGHSIFGYFLPLMTILGEIVDLHHARNHPRFGVGFRSGREWDDQTAEITRHLEAYERSLKMFEQQHFHVEDKNNQSGSLEMPGDLDHINSPSVRSVHTSSSRMTESDIQTRIVVAYGTHVMHVLHILLTGKWDPINLLDDNDLWISSQGFITATGHAVSAAEAINNILEYDPGLEFMPFFFGIYLLQGSFLLLLIADKLQLEASASVVRACETIIRAHEACVVTLNTEYQRNFSKVMRSALAQVRGRVPEDLGEQHQRRRELLSLYRWTGDGTGLAL